MNKEKLLTILVAPHVSEKATSAAGLNNQAVFRVHSGATKPEVKAAVEYLFDVKVAAVNIVNVKGKRKRFGQRMGKRSNLKKAYVRLAAGDVIDFSGTSA